MKGNAEDLIRKLIGPLEAKGIGLETLREKGQVVSPLLPDVPFGGGRFPTLSGRFRFPADLRLPDDGLTPGSLFLVTPKAKAFQNSEILAAEDPGVPTAFLHPAAAPGVHDGDEVDLVSSVGRLRVRVSLNEKMRRDAVRVDQGGHHARGAGVNALAPPSSPGTAAGRVTTRRLYGRRDRSSDLSLMLRWRVRKPGRCSEGRLLKPRPLRPIDIMAS